MRNMLRKMSLLVALVMLVGAVGCAQAATSFQAGTYTAVGKGNNGDVKVSVTFTQDAIETVTVDEHGETAGICDPAIERIPAAIVEGQTLAVDTVSGATNTSNAILAAVEDCVAQAGGDAAALKTAPEAKATENDAVEEITADVAVIGGGGAGLAAAISAGQAGAKVVLLEKGAAVGGNTLLSGGMYNAADPDMDAAMTIGEAAVKELKTYLDLTAEDVGEFAPTLEILKPQIQEYLDSGKTSLFDSPELHIIQCKLGSTRTGLDGEKISPDYQLIQTMCYNALDSWEWLVGLGVEEPEKLNMALGALWQRTHTPVGGASALINTLKDSAVAAGADILLETPAKELLVEDGKVCGVVAQKSDGSKLVVHANAVIMATGGFGGNTEMVAEYNNYWEGLTASSVSDNTPNCTGDGIVMAQAIGADVTGMGFIQLLPTCTAKDAKTCGVGTVLYLNKEGVRYVSEDSERDILCAAAFAQTDGIVYGVGDKELCDIWGDDKLNLYVEKGYSCKADTLAEAAKLAGLDPETVVASVEKFNGYVDAQNDPDFGRYVMNDKVDTLPYVINIMAPAIHHTMGGLKIDPQTHVLGTDGAAIAGLYAAGEVCGGIHAGNRLGGNAVADCVIFGRIAGENAAKAQ